MVVSKDRWGDITVHRCTAQGLWAVSKYVPIIGYSGYICGRVHHIFPIVFYSGREAHRFAKGSSLKNGYTIVTLSPRFDFSN